LFAIQPITSENLQIFKAIRLRALEDAPYAFGSTLAREMAFSDEDWQARLARWNGVAGVGYLAVDAADPCGVAGAIVDPAKPARAQLVSVWTAPTHRRLGVGRKLTQEVLAWAQSRGIGELSLKVTEINAAAIGLYEQLGFTRTGRVEPFANDPTLLEYEMTRPVV
jgi:ribosomal protein S18 acetylase RimI-like enzyme